MGYKSNSAECGSDTVDATTGNTGGVCGDAFASVFPGAGGSVKFSATQAMHGALSYAMTPASGITNFIQLNDVSSSLTFSTRAYVRLTGYPSAETIFSEVRTTAGVNVCRLHLTTAGALKMVNQAGTAVVTFTNVLALNTWYRFVLFGAVAASAAVTAAFYAGDSPTAIETKAQTGVNTGTTAAGQALWGKHTSTGTMAVHYFDDVAQDMQSALEIGPAILAPPRIITNRSALMRAATR